MLSCSPNDGYLEQSRAWPHLEYGYRDSPFSSWHAEDRIPLSCYPLRRTAGVRDFSTRQAWELNSVPPCNKTKVSKANARVRSLSVSPRLLHQQQNHQRRFETCPFPCLVLIPPVVRLIKHKEEGGTGHDKHAALLGYSVGKQVM